MGIASSLLHVLHPPVPDLFASVHESFSVNSFVIVWLRHRSDYFPNLFVIGDHVKQERALYFKSLLGYTFFAYVTLGITATAVANCIKKQNRPYQDALRSGRSGTQDLSEFHPSAATYTPLKIHHTDTSLNLDNIQPSSGDTRIQRALRWKPLLMIITVGYVLVLAALLIYCVVREAISDAYGVAWEFWVIWLNMGLFGGILELCIALIQPGQKPLSLYPKSMFISHIPIISEKSDTAKDLVFIAVVIHKFEYVVAGLTFSILFTSQCYFAWNSVTRSEFLESHLPMLANLRTTDKTKQNDDDMFERGFRAFRAQFLQMVMKQTSPARFQMSLFEDLPQTIAKSYFTLRHGGKLFVLVGVGLSVARMCLASPWLGGLVNKRLLGDILEQRRNAIHVQNAPKVLSLTKIVWAATTDDEPAPELREVDFHAHELLAEGVTVKQLILAGYPVKELFAAGVTPLQIANEGLSAGFMREHGSKAKYMRQAFGLEELVEAGYDAKELLQANFTILELKEFFRIAEFKHAGKTANELSEAGYDVSQLRSAKFTAKEAKDSGFSTLELKQGGYLADDCKAAGCSLDEMKEAGFKSTQMKLASYSALDLKEVGYTIHDLKDAEYSLTDLIHAGCACKELAAASFSLVALAKAGFSMEDCREAGFTAVDFKVCNFSMERLKEAGFTAKEVRDAQFTPAEMQMAGYSATEMRDAGCNLKDLKSAGMTAKVLKSQGFHVSKLLEAGYTVKACKAAGFLEEFKKEGVPYDVIEKSFNLVEKRQAGYLPQPDELPQLKAAGATARDLKKCCFSCQELKLAGFTAVQLEEAEFTLKELKTAGFTIAELKHLMAGEIRGRGWVEIDETSSMSPMRTTRSNVTGTTSIHSRPSSSPSKSERIRVSGSSETSHTSQDPVKRPSDQSRSNVPARHSR